MQETFLLTDEFLTNPFSLRAVQFHPSSGHVGIVTVAQAVFLHPSTMTYAKVEILATASAFPCHLCNHLRDAPRGVSLHPPSRLLATFGTHFPFSGVRLPLSVLDRRASGWRRFAALGASLRHQF